jgi:uncharacterized Zn-binding protein involved in type VI secretion
VLVASPPRPGKPAAKAGDQVVGIDTHIILVPSPGGPVPTPMPLPFVGVLTDALSADVFAENAPLAVQGSVATNLPPHVPPGGPFQSPPKNRATVQTGSSSVFANNKPVATLGSTAMTCNDPVDAPNGSVIGTAATLSIGP